MVEYISDIISITGILNSLQLKDIIALIIIIIISFTIIRIIIYRETNKINKELERLNEKLIIYKRLAIIEEKLKI
jgi:hypothetical protein